MTANQDLSWITNRSRRSPRRLRRKGAILTLELLLILPIVVALGFGIVQISLLLAAQNRLNLATAAACRTGTLPSANRAAQRRAVTKTAERALAKPRLIREARLRFRPGRYSGDRVRVVIRLPMTAAAPDILRWLGFSLRGRTLVARTTMRKE